MNILQLVLLIVTVALIIQVVVYAAKHDYVKQIDWAEPFTLRYPKIFLWIAIVFFAAIGFLLLNMVIWQDVRPFAVILLAVLAVCSLPALLLALRWKIEVSEEYLVHTPALGGKKQIYYKDIRHVLVTPKIVVMDTTLKKLKFISGVYYMEDLLFRLRENGVDIDRQP
ncbi:MAG: hypothetical protein VB081_13320 [Christensenella sp.]|uniref:hypothetical protein n=1 Tax=Christensenella sp. TaxID=1935934 RepID=UPI002B209D78|nr:hypothetical protein [Christensenella sp.]MEA5004459.1 hypothetical protein [Christensenella sp.]